MDTTTEPLGGRATTDTAITTALLRSPTDVAPGARQATDEARPGR
ncbi:hypothetical protein [Mycobacterium arosiense]|nr:hypothetical protein [Mycobacterium arosiense]